jgi:EAL domain-containing protein (putative c-di-GMP-specific phosphodiesterase class I)
MTMSIGMNLSTEQLESPCLLETIRRALESHPQVSAEDLVVNVSESRPVRSGSIAEAALSELAASGVRIALANFGADRASLDELTRLPLSFLKLDQRMIATMPSERRTRAVVGGVAQICQEVGISVVADGVRNEAEMAACWDAGVSFAQGPFVARPTRLEEILESTHGEGSVDAQSSASFVCLNPRTVGAF